MSDNPFESPQVEPGKPTGGNLSSPPGALKVIPIVCLVLGVMGLMSVCTTGFGLAVQSWAVSMMEQESPESPQTQIQMASVESVKQLMIPIIIMTIIGLGVAVALVAGGIGTLSMKEKFRKILRIGCLAAAGYQLIKIAISAYSTSLQGSAIQRVVDNPDFQADQQSAALVSMTSYMAWGGFALGAVIALAMLAFYLWSATYLQKPESRKYFQ